MCEGGKKTSYFKDVIAPMCADLSTLTNGLHLSWGQAPEYKQIMGWNINYVRHNVARHLLSRFRCDET